MTRNLVASRSGRFIDRLAKVASGCTIGAGTVISGKVELKAGVVVEPNVVIYGPARVGERTYLGANAVVGFPSRSSIGAKAKRKKPSNSDVTEIGGNCVIRSGCVVYSGVKVFNRVSFGHNAMIRENVLVDDNTVVGSNVVVDGFCKIGKHVSIQTGVYVCTNSTIEDYVFLGPCCVFLNDKFASQKPTELVGPKVRKCAAIGGNATLMPGVEVGERAIVGAHSLVMHSVAPRMMVVGVPARVIKQVPDDWRSQLLESCLTSGCHKLTTD